MGRRTRRKKSKSGKRKDSSRRAQPSRQELQGEERLKEQVIEAPKDTSGVERTNSGVYSLPSKIGKKDYKSWHEDIPVSVRITFPESALGTGSKTSKLTTSSAPVVGREKFPWKLFFLVVYMAVFLVLGAILLQRLKREMLTSEGQAQYLGRLQEDVFYSVGSGASQRIRFPSYGPHDVRLGYTRIPQISDRLTSSGFEIRKQAVLSLLHSRLIDWGVFPIYREKAQAGLSIVDRDGTVLVQHKTPQRIFQSFEEIPQVIVKTLLFIEDRNLLNEAYPYHNPAIEWDRFGKAVLDVGVSKVREDHDVHGGSTLATQMEKYRHSPDGLTRSPKDKLEQMTSAALRAYRHGPTTLKARRLIALDYINTVPLAAVHGFGEVNGLGDGLWAYFGSEFEELSKLLRKVGEAEDQASLKSQAKAYRQVVSLFLAHRRPSEYLGNNPDKLRKLVEKYLPLLAREGVVPEELVQAALAIDVKYRREFPPPQAASFLRRKGTTLVRTHLLNILDVPRLYDLDRYDLTAESTLDGKSQQAVTELLVKMADSDFVKKNGMSGFRLLDPKSDLSKVIYSFTLYERTGSANVLRVQTDNLDQPFNVNKGVKLDLGSTSKLRTLVTYLEIITRVYERLRQKDKKELGAIDRAKMDPLSRWVLNYIRKTKQHTLRTILDAAMKRQYSGSPYEKFFTGAGVHTFSNFSSKHNGGTYSLGYSLQHSINLPFVRVMRDIVRFYERERAGGVEGSFSDLTQEQRQDYLRRFAHREGKEFLRKFYYKYKGKDPIEIFKLTTKGLKNVHRRAAVVYWHFNPEGSIQSFRDYLKQVGLPDEDSDETLKRLHKIYSDPERSLGDKTYLARIHPLEMWVVGYLASQKSARLRDVYAETEGIRIEAYAWLFRAKSLRKQDKRIKVIIEEDAFKELHKSWVRLGYPHPSLVPSYATALGTSADTPDGLAELMGIIVNNGRRKPAIRVERMVFGKDTPFETEFARKRGEGTQLLAPEIAQVVKAALFDVVSKGTAVRIRNGFQGQREQFRFGGKTGTGDHRHKVYSSSGQLKEDRVVNRTATFVFLINEDFFGTLTVFVPGRAAANYGFTSSLAVQLVKIMEPALLPVLERGSTFRVHSTSSK